MRTNLHINRQAVPLPATDLVIETTRPESRFPVLTGASDGRRLAQSTEGTPRKESPTQLPERNLDVLRAVAVLCVLLTHAMLLVTQPASRTASIDAIGNAGVQLFFVHTALVLMASLERDGGERPSIGRFYLRRAFRIYPLAIVTVLLVVAAGIPKYPPAIGRYEDAVRSSPAVVVANLALVQNLLNLDDVIGPFWTLPVEVDMYLLLPFCYLVARNPRARNMFALLAALIAANYIATESKLPGVWRLNVLRYGPCFFGGVLAFHLLRHRARAKLPSWTLAPTLFAAVAAVQALALVSSRYVTLWVPCLALGLTLPWIAELPASAVTAVGKTIAKYSYGIYLLHDPIFWFAFGVCRAFPLGTQILIAVVCIFVVPWVAFHAVEQPAIRLGQRLTQRRLAVAAVQPAP